MSLDTSSHRIDYFDWLRCFACLAVVLIHVCAAYAAVHPIDELPLQVALRLMWIPTVLARWAVPVFLMITGALLLDPQRDIAGQKLLRYIVRMLVIMLTFGLAFSVLRNASEAVGFSLDTAIASFMGLLDGTSWGHLWYVVSLIGLYAITPILRAFTERARVEHVELALLILYVTGCVIPLINDVFGLAITTVFPVPFELFYFLLGHYAHSLIDKGVLSRFSGDFLRPIAIMGVCCLIAILAIVGWCITRLAWDGYIFTDPMSCFIGPFALLVFALFQRYINQPMPDNLPGRSAHWISTHCLGIYIVHPLFTRGLKLLGLQDVYMALPLLLGELLVTFVVLAMSCALVWLFDRTRFCREFLRL